VLLLLLLVVVLVVVVVVVVLLVVLVVVGEDCGDAAGDWVCFNKLNGFLNMQYAIFWIYLSINNDSMYFKNC